MIIPPPRCGVPWTGLIQVQAEETDETFRCVLTDLDISASVKGPLEVGSVGVLYLARVLDFSPLRLDFSKASVFVPHCPPSSLSFGRLKEACAGLGGIGIGCEQLSASVMASVDINTLACEHLRRNGRKSVICGDICKDEVIKVFHLAGTSESTVLSAGIPCQPFSPQGDRREFNDSRSQAYWGVLKAARFMNACSLLLECVPRAGQNQRVIQSLNEFADLRGWKVFPVILSLNDMWPSTRVRWWCLLQPAHFPAPALDSWPTPLVKPILQNYIHEWPILASLGELVKL